MQNENDHDINTMTAKMKRKRQSQYQPQHHLSWEQISHLLTSQPQSHKSNNVYSKKLRLKILDTVFLKNKHDNFNSSTNEYQFIDDSNNEEGSKSLKEKVKTNHRSVITQWCFTTKKGEAMRRKDTTVLTLQHVYDRFCRFALANTSNAAGPRIVAVGYEYGHKKLHKNQLKELKETNPHKVGLLRQRVNYTVEQFKREVKNINNNSNYSNNDTDGGIFKSICLQCYLRPYGGIDQLYRGVFQLVLDPNYNENDNVSNRDVIKNDITVQIVDDVDMANGTASDFGHSSIRQLDQECSTLHQWIQKEVEVSVLKIVHHLESVMASYPSTSKNNSGDHNVNDDDSDQYPLEKSDLPLVLPRGYCRQKIVGLTANFILDDNKQLWLACIDSATIGAKDNLVEEIHMASEEAREKSFLVIDDANKNDQDIVLPQIIAADCANSNDKNKEQSSKLLTPCNGSIMEEKNYEKYGKNMSSTFEKDQNENHGNNLQTKVSLFGASFYIIVTMKTFVNFLFLHLFRLLS